MQLCQQVEIDLERIHDEASGNSDQGGGGGVVA